MRVRACGYDRKEFLSLANFNDYAALVQASVNQNNTWSAQQAQKQMDFQRQMSNTAHQREVADLKAAGLNPVLSAQSNGASTPSGASASGDTSGTTALVELLKEFGEGIAGAVSSGYGSGSAKGFAKSIQDGAGEDKLLTYFLEKSDEAPTWLKKTVINMTPKAGKEAVKAAVNNPDSGFNRLLTGVSNAAKSVYNSTVGWLKNASASKKAGYSYKSGNKTIHKAM